MFEPAPADAEVFHVATGLDTNAIAQVQQSARRQLLRVFLRRGLLPDDDAQAMVQWEHGGGFSVDASVRIEASDCGGRERLLRYCARPPFALDRLRELAPERSLYERTKLGPHGSGPQILTPLQLLNHLAALVPPPAPPPELPAAEPAHRGAARHAWALLLARINEVFPLVCPQGGAEMRIIAFITDGPTVRDLLVHLGEPAAPPRIAPARGPPLWDLPGAGPDNFDPHAHPAPAYAFDRRRAW